MSATLRQLEVTIPPSMCEATFHTCVEDLRAAVMEQKGAERHHRALRCGVCEGGVERAVPHLRGNLAGCFCRAAGLRVP